MSKTRREKGRIFPTAEGVIQELLERLKNEDTPEEEKREIDAEIDRIVERIPF